MTKAELYFSIVTRLCGYAISTERDKETLAYRFDIETADAIRRAALYFCDCAEGDEMFDRAPKQETTPVYRIYLNDLNGGFKNTIIAERDLESGGMFRVGDVFNAVLDFYGCKPADLDDISYATGAVSFIHGGARCTASALEEYE